MLFEFFLLKYIFLLIGGMDNVYLVILTLLIGINHFVPMIFEANKSRAITRFLTTLDGVWMWASVWFLIDIVAIYIIGIFVTLSFEMNIAMLAIVPILGVYNYWKAHRIIVREKTVELKNLTHDISIAHLSDVHFGSGRHRKLIGDICDKLNSLDCQLAIISGDLADGSSAVGPDDFFAFKDVIMPIIFTPGNHDFYPGIENVIEACEKADIIVLDNESMIFDCLNIHCLTFSFEDRTVPKLDGSIIDSDRVNILNYHVPYYWNDFSKLGFDIQLSGHTHGGQFYPAILFSYLIFDYNKGLFKNESGKYNSCNDRCWFYGYSNEVGN